MTRIRILGIAKATGVRIRFAFGLADFIDIKLAKAENLKLCSRVVIIRD